jgi:hypothetical protein
MAFSDVGVQQAAQHPRPVATARASSPLAGGTGQLSRPHRDLFGQHQPDVGGRVECVSFGM